MALTKFELEKFLIAWKSQYGEEKTSRKGNKFFAVPAKSEPRQHMYRVLLTILMNQFSYTKDDFDDLFCNTIVMSSTPEDYDKKALDGWRKAARNDLLAVVGDMFPMFKDEEVEKKERIETTKPEVAVQKQNSAVKKPATRQSLYEERPSLEGIRICQDPTYVIDKDMDLLAGLEDEE